MVKAWIEISMLLWNNEYSFVFLHFFVFVGIDNCALDVDPDIRSIVPIEINDLFSIGIVIWRITLKGDGV